jgi:hypothetical protein
VKKTASGIRRRKEPGRESGPAGIQHLHLGREETCKCSLSTFCFINSANPLREQSRYNSGLQTVVQEPFRLNNTCVGI